MKPAWDQLAEAWQDSTSVLIADVDCTAEGGKEVCSEQGVQGYPTIKYYTAETGRAGKDYAGGRDFNALNDFVEKELAEECDEKTQKSCSEKEVGYIEKMRAKGSEAWSAEASRLEGLAAQGMSDEKKKWLNQRINVLEQLLGKKVRRPRSGSWSWYFWTGSLVVSSLAVVTLFFCKGDAAAVPKEHTGGQAPKEEKKSD